MYAFFEFYVKSPQKILDGIENGWKKMYVFFDFFVKSPQKILDGPQLTPKMFLFILYYPIFPYCNSS